MSIYILTASFKEEKDITKEHLAFKNEDYPDQFMMERDRAIKFFKLYQWSPFKYHLFQLNGSFGYMIMNNQFQPVQTNLKPLQRVYKNPEPGDSFYLITVEVYVGKSKGEKDVEPPVRAYFLFRNMNDLTEGLIENPELVSVLKQAERNPPDIQAMQRVYRRYTFTGVETSRSFQTIWDDLADAKAIEKAIQMAQLEPHEDSRIIKNLFPPRWREQQEEEKGPSHGLRWLSEEQPREAGKQYHAFYTGEKAPSPVKQRHRTEFLAKEEEHLNMLCADLFSHHHVQELKQMAQARGLKKIPKKKTELCQLLAKHIALSE